MKKYRFGIIAVLVVVLASCAPVLRKDYMEAGIRDVPLSEVKHNPESYRGKLFVLGGIIVNAKLTKEGSLVEAIHVQVDSLGYLTGGADGRYLALYPKESGTLDPQIFRKGRRITVAGEFVGTRQGKIDDAEYEYPLFYIKDIYLWEDRMYYYPSYPYYYPYWGDYPYSYWWHGPFWRPYPYWW